ncbi:MAG: 3-oxoacyl-ACP synthase [Candidatus Izemoplasmatales bacterium]
MKIPTVGIVGTGIYLPNNYITAKEISAETNGVWAEEKVIEKLGIIKKTIPGKTDGTQEMGVKAALNALKNTNVKPDDIDVILCVGEEWKEYPLTTSALYIQNKIKAINAWGIDLTNRCCATVSAMKIAKDMLIADENINTIMIVGGYRNGDLIDYQDDDLSLMFNLGCGGAAIILKKNYKQNQLLGCHIISESSLSRTARVEIGGITNPITHDNLEKSKKSFKFVETKKVKDKLEEISMKNWFMCIDKALEMSYYSRKDIDYLAIPHIKRSKHKEILVKLGLTEEQTIYLENYGHIGQVDQILSLEKALEVHKVKDGSVVCMLAAGIGYVWAANIIKWGKY